MRDEPELKRRMELLPKQQKIALSLHLYEHLSDTEISKVLGIPEAEVARLLHAAKQILMNSP